MKARYRSTCPMCNKHIHPGDEIRTAGQTTIWRHVVCPDPEHLIQPHQEAAARAYGVDSTFVAFVARLLLEQGSEESAWQVFCELNEWWDGEDIYRNEALARWQATLPFAHAQNALIHPQQGGN